MMALCHSHYGHCPTVLSSITPMHRHLHILHPIMDPCLHPQSPQPDALILSRGIRTTCLQFFRPGLVQPRCPLKVGQSGPGSMHSCPQWHAALKVPRLWK